MTDVFLSRPTWVPSPFEAGLEGFVRFLKSIGLNPRTIGTTDFATKSPLDDVIRLVDRCAAAVILGYPQIVVTAGTCKDKTVVSPLLLPTEWNHIEAGLAHARGLPLLVIHHVGVARGIFDRGAIPNFIYEADLEQSAWPLMPAIRGAVEAWKADCLEGGLQARRGSPEGAPQRAQPITAADVAVLKTVCDSESALSARQIAAQLGLSVQKAHYHLDLLIAAGLLDRGNLPGEPHACYLSPKGRRLLVEQELL